MSETKTAALREKIDSIHYANVLYWREGSEQHSREASLEHKRRQRRLREIRAAQHAGM